MSDISKPHDRFFRETFSHPDVSSDFLNNYLPPEVVRHIDTKSIELIKDSFIDNELREHFSDILCKVRLFSGGYAYVYTLFEHKSWPDSLVAFQLLRYMTRIWEQDFRNYEAEKKKKRKKGDRKKSDPFRPVLIIPVVIYHGQQKWNISEKFSALFDCAPELEFGIPDFSYILCDLSRYEDHEIRGMLMLRIGLLVMKYIFREDLTDRLPEVLSLFQELMNQTTGVEYLKTVLTYLAG
ncbi:MAG: Rpn family recombination-promoting nuclease/putative transposase, partial [Desulfococcaceae bacterium]|nr:Rpn family recombination-promoting nuclease/putative transposase [Desulfococcaceae bacterium]